MMKSKLTEFELGTITGGTPAEDAWNLFQLGEYLGKNLAHHTGPVSPPPFCYEYGVAYPAPVLPCRH